MTRSPPKPFADVPPSELRSEEEREAIEARRRRTLDRSGAAALRTQETRSDLAGAAAATSARWARERAEEPYQAPGDPLNILPENARVAAKAAKERQRRLKREGRIEPPRTAAKRDIEARGIIDPNNTVVQVKARTRKFMRGLLDHQEQAAIRFEHDYDLATSNGIRPAKFEPTVDGGAIGADMNASRLAAGDRLFALRKAIGTDSFELLVCVIAQGATVRDIHRAGGPEHRVSSEMIKLALDHAAEFYGLQVSAGPMRRAISRLRADSVSGGP